MIIHERPASVLSCSSFVKGSGQVKYVLREMSCKQRNVQLNGKLEVAHVTKKKVAIFHVSGWLENSGNKLTQSASTIKERRTRDNSHFFSIVKQ